MNTVYFLGYASKEFNEIKKELRLRFGEYELIENKGQNIEVKEFVRVKLKKLPSEPDFFLLDVRTLQNTDYTTILSFKANITEKYPKLKGFLVIAQQSDGLSTEEYNDIVRNSVNGKNYKVFSDSNPSKIAAKIADYMNLEQGKELKRKGKNTADKKTEEAPEEKGKGIVKANERETDGIEEIEIFKEKESAEEKIRAITKAEELEGLKAEAEEIDEMKEIEIHEAKGKKVDEAEKSDKEIADESVGNEVETTADERRKGLKSILLSEGFLRKREDIRTPVKISDNESIASMKRRLRAKELWESEGNGLRTGQDTKEEEEKGVATRQKRIWRCQDETVIFFGSRSKVGTSFVSMSLALTLAGYGARTSYVQFARLSNLDEMARDYGMTVKEDCYAYGDVLFTVNDFPEGMNYHVLDFGNDYDALFRAVELGWLNKGRLYIVASGTTGGLRSLNTCLLRIRRIPDEPNIIIVNPILDREEYRTYEGRNRLYYFEYVKTVDDEKNVYNLGLIAERLYETE